ncbi:MAG: hypothetical protein ACR2OG_12495 [Gemmatimonadaceae bacterium]
MTQNLRICFLISAICMAVSCVGSSTPAPPNNSRLKQPTAALYSYQLIDRTMHSAWNSGLPSQSPEIAKKQYRNVRKEFRAYCNIAWFEMPNWEYDSITVFGTGLGGTSGVYLGDVFVADNLGYNFSQLDLNKKRLTAGLGFHIFWTEDVYYYNGGEVE